MTVQFIDKDFAILNEKDYINKNLGGRCIITDVLYAIDHPFYMKSQNLGSQSMNRKIKNEKRKKSLAKKAALENPGFQAVINYVKEIHAKICEVWHSSASTSTKPMLTPDLNCGNKLAKDCARVSGCYYPTQKAYQNVNYEYNATILANTSTIRIGDIASCLHENKDAKSCVEVYIDQQKYLIPPRCAFFIGDVHSGLDILVHNKERYDLIIIDPPWNNKSVKRLKSYVHSDENEWWDLPVEELLTDNGLIALWITNNSRQIKYAWQLANKWGVVHRTLTWLKVTKYCEPVCKFDQNYHKAPFESVLLISKEKNSDARNCEDFTFCSVPCAIPGKKPPLSDLLKTQGLLCGEPRVLDIFGRCVLTNVTSVGYEAIKFNSIDQSCLLKLEHQ